MKSIGFKNFRRFANLDPLPLGDITFFVGGNNAGKSTVVKAMLLLSDNLISKNEGSNDKKTNELPYFRLDANRIHEVHIGTFGRALHKPYPEQKEIILEADVDDFHFCYVLTGDTESKLANAGVARIEITDKLDNVLFVYNFVDSEVIIKYNTSVLKKYTAKEDNLFDSDEEARTQLSKLTAQRDELSKKVNITEDPVEIARLNSSISTLSRSILTLSKTIGKGRIKKEDVEYKCELEIPSVRYVTLIHAILDKIKEKFEEDQDNNKPSQTLSPRDKAFRKLLIEHGRRLFDVIFKGHIDYISAHAASQKVLFSIEDKNDYMASVIREFKQCRINRGNKEYIFITKWMKELKIGLDFQIDAISGEAYTMEITNMQGSKMPLADMGMGSIQMMILLLKLATILNKKQGRDTIIIVEEPEQNLHPLLQSRLAELFASVNREYGFRFVIETHSEYIIRKSQAMIASGEVEFEKNPFKVFFFPEKGEPYDMVYQENGRFKETFDSGFFDEAAKWTSEISAVELKNAPKQEFQWEGK